MAKTLRELVVALSLDSSNFSRNMRTINQQIKEAESTFRLAGAGVQNYEKTIAGTEAKLSMLGLKLTQQQLSVGNLGQRFLVVQSKYLVGDGNAVVAGQPDDTDGADLVAGGNSGDCVGHKFLLIYNGVIRQLKILGGRLHWQ